MATQSVPWSSPATTTGREVARLVRERGPFDLVVGATQVPAVALG